MFPRQSSTTHTEFLGDEASVYDWAQGKVHALNPTAASVWRRCDGATTADEIAVAVHRELGIPDTDAVVDLTLKEFAGLHLLEQPVESLVRHAATDATSAARARPDGGDAAGGLHDPDAVCPWKHSRRVARRR